MQISDFRNLNFTQRCDAIWEWGFLVGRRREQNQTRVLYKLNGFFAEMLIRSTDNEVIDVLPLEKLDILVDQSFEILGKSPFVQTHQA